MPHRQLDSPRTTNVPLLHNNFPLHHADHPRTPSSSTYSLSRNPMDSDKQWKPSEKIHALSSLDTRNLPAPTQRLSDSRPPTVPFLLCRPLPILPQPPLNLIPDQLPSKKGKPLASLQPNLLVADSASNVPGPDTGTLIAPPTPASTAVNQLLVIALTTAQSSKTLRRRRATIGTTTRTIADGTWNTTTISSEMTDMPTLQANLTEVEGNPVRFPA